MRYPKKCLHRILKIRYNAISHREKLYSRKIRKLNTASEAARQKKMSYNITLEKNAHITHLNEKSSSERALHASECGVDVDGGEF